MMIFCKSKKAAKRTLDHILTLYRGKAISQGKQGENEGGSSWLTARDTWEH